MSSTSRYSGSQSKYAMLRQKLTPLLKKSDFTVKQLVSIGVHYIESDGYQTSVAEIEKEIRMATRPVGHWKNKWGFRCATDPAGSGKFGVSFVKDKFSGIVTIEEDSRYQTKTDRTQTTKTTILLDDSDIEGFLKDLSGWHRAGNEISKVYRCKTFVDSIGFVNKIAILAEKTDHHPDILINYSKVTITLSTHSEEGITIKDIILAKEIEGLR